MLRYHTPYMVQNHMIWIDMTMVESIFQQM